MNKKQESTKRLDFCDFVLHASRRLKRIEENYILLLRWDEQEEEWKASTSEQQSGKDNLPKLLLIPYQIFSLLAYIANCLTPDSSTH